MFVEGQEYSRLRDIHEMFGGQRQGGISTPASHPYVFIFTGKGGEQHGYRDGWKDDGVFLYTGEGQIGDMRFKAGNAAVRDHDQNSKELLMFEALGKGKPVRFLGRYACQSWDTFLGPDKMQRQRECIQFHLVKLEANVQTSNDMEGLSPTDLTLKELRERALHASKPYQAKSWKDAPASYRRRSRAVREYVLARASGICELTGRPAPFSTASGSPYLEVHHTRRLSDDGPDHPRWVAAIDPTIHREIHFGADGSNLNRKLMDRLRQIEGD